MKEIELTRVRSSRPQVCSHCGKLIPARAESIKYVIRSRGMVSKTVIHYRHISCKKEGMSHGAIT